MILFACIEPDPLQNPNGMEKVSVEDISQGAQLSLKLMQQVYNGLPVKAIRSCQITNVDQHQETHLQIITHHQKAEWLL